MCDVDVSNGYFFPRPLLACRELPGKNSPDRRKRSFLLLLLYLYRIGPGRGMLTCQTRREDSAGLTHMDEGPTVHCPGESRFLPVDVHTRTR